MSAFPINVFSCWFSVPSRGFGWASACVFSSCLLPVKVHNTQLKRKVKWSRYRPGVDQRVGRGIDLLFNDRGTRRGWVVSSTSRPQFTPRKDPVPILQEAGQYTVRIYTGLFKMIVGDLTTCHKQYTWDRSVCVFLFNRTKLQDFVAYLIGTLYVNPLWFYKHQHDNRVRPKLFVACQRWWFQWRFSFLPSIPGYTRTLSFETVRTIFEWNCQMVVVSRIWCGIDAGQLYPDDHYE